MKIGRSADHGTGVALVACFECHMGDAAHILERVTGGGM